MSSVVVRVHAHLEGPLEDVTPTEDAISTTIAIALSGTSIEERSRIWERAQLKLIAAKKGQSVVLYVWCETVEELFHLHESLTSGHLKDSVELLFNHLLTTFQKVVLKRVTMQDEELKLIKGYITGDQLFCYQVSTFYMF